MMVQLPDNERKNMTMMTATQALSVNPATGQTLAAMPQANAQEIEHALSLAASGFKSGK
ncbi:hypothetical protein JS561_01010 [Salmonella enterica subsp. enterica serovar Infantis]|nr:hypothetical protein JS561_01010 [Salmonella enterica subsp. enterica serovar Infantis]